MYRIVRTVHLCAALSLALLTLLYAISGYFMNHREWFPIGSRRTFERVDLSSLAGIRPESPAQADALVPRIRETLELRGRAEVPKQNDRGGFTFNFDLPGVVRSVDWHPDSTSAILSTVRRDAVFTMNRLHQLHLFDGGVAFAIWAVLLDLVSLAMILFAGTGVYLWYRLKRNHRLGLLFLGASTVFAVAMVLFLAYRA